MTDQWLQLAFSNLCVSCVLALLACAVQGWGRFPHLTNVLWLLVLVKLCTPALFTVPLLPIGTVGHGVADAALIATNAQDLAATPAPLAPIAQETATWSVGNLLLLAWAAGSVIAAFWSLNRLARFQRLLALACKPASEASAAHCAEPRQTTRHPQDAGDPILHRQSHAIFLFGGPEDARGS